MDNSQVAAPNSSAQNQNNSKSDPNPGPSEMETETGNDVQIPSSAKSNPDTAATTAATSGPEGSPEINCQERAEALSQSKAENPETSKESTLYPALPEDSQTAPQDRKTEPAANLESVMDRKPSLGTDCDPRVVPDGKSSGESVPSEHAGALDVESKERSVNPALVASAEAVTGGGSPDDEEKRKRGNTDASPTADGALAESQPAPPTRDSVTEGAEASPAASASETAAEGGAVGGKKSGSSQGESVYYVKWITFNNSKVPIITQNENGPCPLLAVMNVLLLKGKVRLAPIVEMITSEQLMAHLGDCVVESMPKNLDETSRANYEQNMQDAMDLMHKLQTGLDVNVKFTGVSDFEYTSECIIFDLLEIGLYHGWLVDPQDEENVKAVGKCSYNQLVEKIIQYKQSDNDEMVREALVAEQFLDRTAAQLTYHGLCELSNTVKGQELCVFFRNNHFGTLYRHNSELFLLVTDQGFLTESNVVWETLSNVDGDCHFVDANFCTYTKPPPSNEPIPTSPYSSGDEQINSDYQVALSLQHHDQQMMAEQEAAWGQFHSEYGASQNADHELAVRLQEEEDRRAAAAIHEQRSQQAQGQAIAQGQGGAGPGGDRRPRDREDRRDKKEGKDCCIL